MSTASTRGLYAVAVAALIIASLAVGFAAYNTHKINSLMQSQSKTSSELRESIGNLSREIGGLAQGISGLQSNITGLASRVAALESAQKSSKAALEGEIKSLSATLEDLKSRVESLQEQQGAQAANLTSVVETINSLEGQLASLQRALEGQATNLTSLAERLRGIEARIDRLYSLYLFPVTVTDATGKPVTIASRPTRIVSLLPSVTEILWAVNASSQVIAVDEYSNYPPQVVELVKEGKLVNIGSGWYPNVELILSLKPDLVIGVDSVPSHHTLKRILAEYGIPVLLLPDKNFKDVLDSIIIVGRATGHPAEAAELASRLEQQAVALRSYIDEYLNTTGTPRQKVALIAWINPLWIAGSETFQNDIILLAGGVNAYSNVTGWKAVSPESLLDVNPDVIVVTAGHAGINMTRAQFVSYLKQYLGDAVYNITAVKEGRIYFVSGDYNDMMVRPAPRIVKAAILMAALLYPQAFNLTPSQIPAQVNPQTFQLPSIPSK